jgi:2-keto-4-pentenoate hydratase/2-oxohepta-3-ene-1,7-dioic acid hydratase in catechol pathway
MGDLIYTGTPAGVGPVQVGDTLRGYIVTRTGPIEQLVCEVK